MGAGESGLGGLGRVITQRVVNGGRGRKKKTYKEKKERGGNNILSYCTLAEF